MNKYKLLILICFFLITITLPKVTASVNSMNLLGKVIILDSGHGGVDAGATGNQIIEKDLNNRDVNELYNNIKGSNIVEISFLQNQVELLHFPVL